MEYDSQPKVYLTPNGSQGGRRGLPAAIVEVFDIGRPSSDLLDERERSLIHSVPDRIVGTGGNELHPGACHTEFIRFERAQIDPTAGVVWHA